jgi:hypothetical protein
MSADSLALCPLENEIMIAIEIGIRSASEEFAAPLQAWILLETGAGQSKIWLGFGKGGGAGV